jgi:hypothetical protein
LLTTAEAAGFDLLLTTDKNIRYQQNLKGRKIAIVVLGNSAWRMVRKHLDRVAAAVNAATSGSYAGVEFPSSKALGPVFAKKRAAEKPAALHVSELAERL